VATYRVITGALRLAPDHGLFTIELLAGCVLWWSEKMWSGSGRRVAGWDDCQVDPGAPVSLWWL